jgi:hypothetical protein
MIEKSFPKIGLGTFMRFKFTMILLNGVNSKPDPVLQEQTLRNPRNYLVLSVGIRRAPTVYLRSNLYQTTSSFF